MIQKHITEINFGNRPVPVKQYVVTEYPQKIDAMFRMLELAGWNVTQNEMAAWYTGQEPIPQDDIRYNALSDIYTVRRRCPDGDFFVKPEEDTAPVSLHLLAEKPIHIRLLVPTSIINADCSGEAVRRVLRDIAAETKGCPPDTAMWKDFLNAPENILKKYGVTLEKEDSFLSITDLDSNRIRDESQMDQYLTISKKEAGYLEKVLTDSSGIKPGKIFSATAAFQNGCRMEIVCQKDAEKDSRAYTEATILAPDGTQLSCSQKENCFAGLWELAWNGRIYDVTIDIK